MIWRGIVRDTTDVDDTPGVSHYQTNTRMRIEGELQRRFGFLSSELDQESGPILGLMAGNNFMVSEASPGELIGHVVPAGIPVGPGVQLPVIAVQGVPCVGDQDWWIGEVVPAELFVQPTWGAATNACPGEVTLVFDAAQIATTADVYNSDLTNTFFTFIANIAVNPGGIVTVPIPINDAVCGTATVYFVFWGQTEEWLLSGQSTLGCA